MQDGKFRQRKQAAASDDKQAANWSGKQHKEATAPASGSAPAPEPAPAQRSRNRRVQPAADEKQAAPRSGEQHKQAAAAGEKQTAAAGEKQPAPQSSVQVPCTDLAPLVSALPDSSQTEGQLDGGGTTGSADCGALRLTNTDPIALYTDTLVPNDTRANTKVREDLYELARPLLEKHLKVRRSDFFTQPKGRAKSARLAIQLDNPNRKPMDVKITELMQRLMQLYGAELPWPGAQGVIMLMLQPREMACTRHNHKMNNGTRAFIFRLEAETALGEAPSNHDGALIVHEDGQEKRLPLNRLLAGTFNPHSDHERHQGAVGENTITITVYTENGKRGPTGEAAAWIARYEPKATRHGRSNAAPVLQFQYDCNAASAVQMECNHYAALATQKPAKASTSGSLSTKSLAPDTEQWPVLGAVPKSKPHSPAGAHTDVVAQRSRSRRVKPAKQKAAERFGEQRKQAAASDDKQAANWSGKQHKEATAAASGSAPAPEPAVKVECLVNAVSSVMRHCALECTWGLIARWKSAMALGAGASDCSIESCAEEMTRMQGRRCTEYFIEQELERSGLSRERVHADGNCLFRAVALAVCGDERQYTTVKRLSAYKMFREVEDGADWAGCVTDEVLQEAYIGGVWCGMEHMQAIAEASEVDVALLHGPNRKWEHITWSGTGGRKRIHIVFTGNHFDFATHMQCGRTIRDGKNVVAQRSRSRRVKPAKQQAAERSGEQHKQAAASDDKQAANWSGKQHKEATAPASGSAPAPGPAPAQRSRNRRVQPAADEKQAAPRSGEQHKQAADAGEKQTAAAGEKQPAPQSGIQVQCTNLAPLVSALPDSSQTEGELDEGTTSSADCGALRLTNTDPIPSRSAPARACEALQSPAGTRTLFVSELTSLVKQKWNI